MKAKKTLTSFLSSAMILTLTERAIAQNKANTLDIGKNPHQTEQILGLNDDFKMDYSTKVSVPILPAGRSTAIWESESCDSIPSMKENHSVMKVLNGEATLVIPIFFLKNVKVQYRTYVDSLGRPIESMLVDYNCSQHEFSHLDSTIIKEEFPERWKDIRGFYRDQFNYKEGIITDSHGKEHPLDSSFTDVQTTYFSVCNMIKDAQSGKIQMPFDTTLNIFDDSVAYKFRLKAENGEKKDSNYIKASARLESLSGGKPSFIMKSIDNITFFINKKNYIPERIKVNLFSGAASADIRLKSYEIK